MQRNRSRAALSGASLITMVGILSQNRRRILLLLLDLLDLSLCVLSALISSFDADLMILPSASALLLLFLLLLLLPDLSISISALSLLMIMFLPSALLLLLSSLYILNAKGFDALIVPSLGDKVGPEV